MQKSTKSPANRVAHFVNIAAGKPTSVLLVIDGKPTTLSEGHPSIPQVLAELKKQSPDADKIKSLLEKSAALAAHSQGKITTRKEGDKTTYWYQGQQLRGPIIDRIYSLMALELPWRPTFRFLENLVRNPSPSARDNLFAFFTNTGLTLTPDGCFIGYKGVQSDFWSIHTGHHTMLSGQQNDGGSIYNAPGEKILVPREEVVEDPSQTCARGLHVGSFRYAKQWAGNGTVVLVKVNPFNTVSVPTVGSLSDAPSEVMRTCGYEVLHEYSASAPLVQKFDAQYMDPDDEDAPLYHSVRDSKGRFTKRA